MSGATGDSMLHPAASTAEQQAASPLTTGDDEEGVDKTGMSSSFGEVRIVTASQYQRIAQDFAVGGVTAQAGANMPVL